MDGVVAACHHDARPPRVRRVKLHAGQRLDQRFTSQSNVSALGHELDCAHGGLDAPVSSFDERAKLMRNGRRCHLVWKTLASGLKVGSAGGVEIDKAIVFDRAKPAIRSVDDEPHGDLRLKTQCTAGRVCRQRSNLSTSSGIEDRAGTDHQVGSAEL